MYRIENRKHVLDNPRSLDDSELDGWVDEITQAPTVTVVCDMEALRASMGNKPYEKLLSEGDLAFGALTMAGKIGRICETLVTVHGPKSDIDLKVWSRFGVQPTFPSPPIHSTAVLTTLRVVDHVLNKPSSVYLWVTAGSEYLDLMRWMVERGRIIACAVPTEGRAYKVKELSSFVMYLEAISSLQDPGFDIDEYEFEGFIRLVSNIEGRLPFVGVKYFVERQMQKLGLKSRKTCHDVFHRAKEMELVLLGTKDNIDTKMKVVSTCKLNREHVLVREVLALSSSDQT